MIEDKQAEGEVLAWTAGRRPQGVVIHATRLHEVTAEFLEGFRAPMCDTNIGWDNEWLLYPAEEVTCRGCLLQLSLIRRIHDAD